MTSRTILPNRRTAERVFFYHDGQKYHGTLGYGARIEERSYLVDALPSEVFLEGPKPGSGINAMCRDFGVVVSIALQYGVPLDVMRKAITRLDDGLAAGPGGMLLDLIGGAS